VVSIQRFYAPMRYGDSIYTVSMLVKEDEGDRRLEIAGVLKRYDAKLEKQTPAGLGEAPYVSAGGLAPAGVDEISVRRDA
jgi:hypothetical protein